MKEITEKAWIRQPLALLRKQGGISKPAALVLAVIIDQATDHDPPAPVRKELAWLAERTGYTTRTVTKALRELETEELIETRRTGRGSVYTLTGCVELLPPKDQEKRKAYQKKKEEAKKKRLAEERREAELLDYLSVVNRFKKDEDPPEVCTTPAEPGDPDYLL